MSSKSNLRIATRRSALAMWQAQDVAQRIEHAFGIKTQLIPLTTSGDQWLEGHLASKGGKGLFVKELETAMRQGQADIAVHSLKDVSVHVPEDLPILAYLERDDPCDALLGAAFLHDLASHATIGTSSLRRAGQLLAMNKDWNIKMLRGNVQRRMQKLAQGDCDATLLACAGLRRLGIQEGWSRVDHQVMLPAVGQGIVVIQGSRQHDLLQQLECIKSRREAECERAVSRTLGGGCHMPIAALARHIEGGLTVTARVMDLQGNCLEINMNGSMANSEEMGIAAGEKLLAQGAKSYLESAIKKSFN